MAKSDMKRQIRELNRKMRKAFDWTAEETHKALFVAAETCRGEIKSVTPVDTGHLVGSIKMVEQKPGPVATIKAGASYAANVEFGSAQHAPGEKGAFMQHGLTWFQENGVKMMGDIVKAEMELKKEIL